MDDKALDMDKKIYDQLANYLNMDLISQPTASATSSSPSISTISSPSTINIDSPMINPSDSFKPILSKPPTILPKPSTHDINQLNTFPSLPLLPNNSHPSTSSSVLINPSIVNNNINSNNINANNNNNNNKRKLSSSSTITTTKDSSSSASAADEDKRRRNTAASARFRIKKKLKEQALVQNVRDMTEKAEKLQNRVHELENEIKWLRDLLLEKNGNK